MGFLLVLSFVFVALLIYGLMHGWFDNEAQGADPVQEPSEIDPHEVKLLVGGELMSLSSQNASTPFVKACEGLGRGRGGALGGGSQ